MSDIVERLRKGNILNCEAADVIDAHRAQIERLLALAHSNEKEIERLRVELKLRNEQLTILHSVDARGG